MGTQPLIQSPGRSIAQLIRETAEPFGYLEEADLGPLLERVGKARVVLLGEATHGTAEFYRMRARITRELILHAGFTMVAVEADWPDARWVDGYVRHAPGPPPGDQPFKRFPTWMWRNREVAEFVEWLRSHNATQANPADRVGFYGLDLYSLYSSIESVLHFLDRTDPDAADLARQRYGCLTPWSDDPAAYGRAAMTDSYRSCETEVVRTLQDLLARRLHYAAQGEDRFLDAIQNARLVADAERYYRVMYYGSTESWNLRDQHMFDTLDTLFGAKPDARAVVWEHNSHVGDAAATEMGRAGQINVGNLCRKKFGDQAYLVGFGTDHGSVAAAHNWDEPMRVMPVRPSHASSYERLFHDSGLAACLLPLREATGGAAREELLQDRLERAIGVIYRPATELASHYFHASLPRQFDEYIWFDETGPVTPLPGPVDPGLPDTYPFGV
ncbi:MAG TPA: erythromycin esterase family protein [Gemmatimonadales bacterium]|nr:erythromycin esterase family protein [Gemmatimonadales bacterium]